ncbi:MAG: EAL domain-containing protein [Bryobacterales bacterium]|nr:EAL domain-containing protein [Bryobacterales bacterium]
MPERKHKLLVVDDEFLNRDMLKERLTRNGYEVAEAEDAWQAMGVIEEGGIDLVLLDTMMPGMSGIDLLKLLRKVHGPSELPVIMATAVSDSSIIAGALDLGANDYIPKPVDFRVALARIKSQLSRRDQDRRVRENEQRHELASRGTGDGIWDWDLTNNRVYYSPRWREMAGVHADAISDTTQEWFGRVHPDDLRNLLGSLRAHWTADSSKDTPFVCEYRLQHKDGTFHWMRGRGYTLRDPNGRVIRMTGSQTDITEQKVHDSLTGLANRLLFLDRAGHALDQARKSSTHFAVLFLDVDRFKLVNDSMGHMVGDRLLIAVGSRLLRAVGEGHALRDWDALTVARFGGDEFAILLDQLSDVREAEEAASRVLRALDEPFDLNGKEVFCSVSIGIAAWNPNYESVEDMLRDADTAMYAAKARGGSGFVMFDDSMREAAAIRLEIESGLRKAVERNELAVFYQPKVNLETGAVVGFEALVRWHHPTLGMVCPAEFIPVAEETGQIVAIGEWVMRQACHDMADWQRRYPKAPPLSISVNLSIRQFRQPDIVGRIAQILGQTGFPADQFHLEITESVVMDDPEGAIATTRKLKELGVGIELDDFGTGYSSLAYLCRMPIDTLKIDRSFIMRMLDSRTDLEVVRTVLTLARSLGIDVVAEGVERSDQLSELRSLCCQFGQGYYFGKPVPCDDTERLLAGAGRDGPASETD